MPKGPTYPGKVFTTEPKGAALFRVTEKDLDSMMALKRWLKSSGATVEECMWDFDSKSYRYLILWEGFPVSKEGTKLPRFVIGKWVVKDD